MPNVLLEVFEDTEGRTTLINPNVVGADPSQPGASGLSWTSPPGSTLRGFITVRDDGALGWEPAE